MSESQYRLVSDQLCDVLGNLQVIGQHRHVMAGEEKGWRRNDCLQLVIAFHPGDHIDDEATGNLFLVIPEDMAAVRTEDGLAFRGIYRHCLESGCMSWCKKQFNSRKNLLISVDKDEPFSPLKPGKI